MNNKKRKLKKKSKDLDKEDAFAMFHNRGMSLDEIADVFEKSTRTIRRWIQEVKQRKSGEYLVNKKSRRRSRRYPGAVFSRIIELKKENPKRSAVVIHRIMKEELGDGCPSLPLVRKHLAANGLSAKQGWERKGYVKFARSEANDLWQIDIAGVRTVGHLGGVYLHALLDDCSRYIVAARYYKDQRGINVLRLLRDAFVEYGRPRQILADNGTQFKNTLGELGTKYTRFLYMVDVEPIFARLRHPQTKGKLERWFGTVVQSFLGEAIFYIKNHPDSSLADLNRLLKEWIHWYNHEKPHRSLSQSCSPSNVYFNSPGRIHRPLEAMIDWDRWFLTAGTRKVSKYNTISYKKETIQLPPGHAGCKVEVLDTQDRFEIYYQDKCLATHVVDIDFVKVQNKEFQRKVKNNGFICYKGVYYKLDARLAGRDVIVREMDKGHMIAVYLDGILLNQFVKRNKKKKG